MRSRARVFVPVVAFALAVALVAVLAGRGGDGDKLVKLPVASMGGPAEADAAAAARSSMPYGVGAAYTLNGTLPDLPDKAPAYRLGDAAAEEAIRNVAAALGLEGEVRTEESGWVLQDGDRALRVMKVPGLPWYLDASCPETPVSDGENVGAMACATAIGVAPPARVAHGAAGSAGGVAQDLPVTIAPVPAVPCAAPIRECTVPEPLPAATPPCPAGAECVVAEPAPPVIEPATKPEVAPEPLPADLVTPPDKPVRPEGFPTREDAERLARETFTRLGAGTEGLVVEDGWMTWEARVEMRVDGLQVLGMDTSVSIGVTGVERANGWLAAPERIGDYPLVGVEAAFTRLTTPPAPEPTPDSAPDGKAAIEPAIAPAVECRDTGGTDVCAGTTNPVEPMPPVEPFVQTVTGAHLALLNMGEFLVPAYVFELAEGGMVPIPAVTDEWLDTQGTGRSGE